MPPRKKVIKKGAVAQDVPVQGPITQGNGITAGLEIWRYGNKFVLVDQTEDDRFMTDVICWNSGAGLNAADLHRIKDATR